MKKHKYDISWEYEGSTVIECQSCGFKHLYPIPSPKELEEFYKCDYFRKVKPFDYDSVTDETVREYKEKATSDESYQRIFDKVNELKKNEFFGMIDIGCGNLLLSYFFKRRGWNEYVIEPSNDAGTYLRRFGLNVINKPIEKVDADSFKKISFINLQFVLEHLVDPLSILEKAYQLLAPGGIIRVCVPNDFSEGQLAYLNHFKDKKAGWICFPDHINYFDFNSINRLLTKVGFEEVYRTTDFPMEFLLMGGINYYASEEERAKVGPFINNFGRSLIDTGRKQTLLTFYELLAQGGFGRSIYMFAIKPT